LDVGLEYATLKNYQMMVAVSLRTKAEWEATTTYSLENYLGNPHFEQGDITGLAKKWYEVGTPTTTLDTTTYLIGTQSQKIVTGTAGSDGIVSDAVSAAETSGVAYAWIYKASGDDITVILWDSTASVSRASAKYSTAGWATKTGANGNTWKRVVVSSDSLVSGNNHVLYVERYSTDATQATTFYVDQCYLELGTSTTPTGWASARNIVNAGDVNYWDFADMPGDRDALCKLRVKNTSGVDQETLFAFMDNAIARYQAIYEAEDYNIGGTDTAEAGNSGGYYNTRTISQSGTGWHTPFQFDFAPSDIEEFSGAFRLLGRARDETDWASTGNFKLRITPTGALDIIKAGETIVGSGIEIQDLGVVKVQPDALRINEPARISVVVCAQKQVGEADYTLAVDYFLLAPLYQATVLKAGVANKPVGSNEYWVLDSEAGQDYVLESAQTYSEFTLSFIGRPLTLPANTSGRIYLLMGDTADDYEIAASMQISIEYRPRGLHFRGSDL